MGETIDVSILFADIFFFFFFAVTFKLVAVLPLNIALISDTPTEISMV